MLSPVFTLAVRPGLRQREHRCVDDFLCNVTGIVWEVKREPCDGRLKLESLRGYIEKILGYSMEEGLSSPQSWLSLVLEEHQEQVIQDVRETLESGNGAVIQFRWMSKDRRVLWAEMHLTSILDSTGQLIGLRGVTLDITDRKHEAGRESEERLRNIADTAPVMIWVSDSKKRRTHHNDQWLNFRGRTLEEELGNGWTEGIHPDDYERCVETYNAAFDNRDPFRAEYRLRRADAQFRWVYESGTPRYSRSAEFLGYIGSCIDISERKAAEEVLRDLTGKLIRAQEDERKQVARELHDDLNQRIALIAIELERIDQSLQPTDTDLRNRVRDVVRQSRELSLEVHKLAYQLHPSKLVHLGLVAAVKSLCAELSDGHGLTIEFRQENVPPGIPKDLSLCLYRVVQESLNNIIRHSGATEAQVQVSGTGGEIHLHISDSGKGIAIGAEKAKKGLGLIIMAERIRLVGGEMAVQSRPSQGTQIDVRVPLEQRTGLEHEGLSLDYNLRAVGG